MIRILLTGSFSLFVFVNVYSQSTTSFSSDIDFANHLIEVKEYKESIQFLNDLLDRKQSGIQKDSINYLIGKAYYLDRELAQSIGHFELISKSNSALWTTGQFYSAFGHNYQKNYTQSITLLNNISSKKGLLQQLKYTQLAGSYLLIHNLEKFDSATTNLNNKHLQLQRTNRRLQNYAVELRNFKRKSPILAGLFSAIIPGSGKIYAGKVGEGISTFFQSLIFGFMARESYTKSGLKSVRFAVFGTLFSTIYISNIWASTFSVKIYRNEYYESLHQSIMLDLHIPIRSIFK